MQAQQIKELKARGKAAGIGTPPTEAAAPPAQPAMIDPFSPTQAEYDARLAAQAEEIRTVRAELAATAQKTSEWKVKVKEIMTANEAQLTKTKAELAAALDASSAAAAAATGSPQTEELQSQLSAEQVCGTRWRTH